MIRNVTKFIDLPITTTQISENLFRIEDTCHVYVIRNGSSAVCVDFGAGRVLDCLDRLGIQHISDVLMTHHHRDQGQGLALAVQHGASIWVPQQEQDLFKSVDYHWGARPVYNNYNVRQDRFSLLEPVPIAGTLNDYSTPRFGATTFKVVPTPGHTPGSISLLCEIDNQRVGFCGDLIAGEGKVWSLAATQWTYNGGEGVAASIPSLINLKKRRPSLLLPSHGEVLWRPAEAIDRLVENFRDLLAYRKQNPNLFSWLEHPYEEITPHLLTNRTSVSNSYVLLSRSGKALILDYGYDFMTGFAAGSDRASRRPWLYSIPYLKQQHGVTKVDVVIPTHYHDDHLAGFNLLRQVEGAQVWAAENFSDVLMNPERYDLPCLWYDPIPVDRSLPLDIPFAWEEYQLTFYALPGHTEYAVAIGFEVDGKRVLVVGDQYQGEGGHLWNYVYQNRFQPDDYRQSAVVYQSFRPDLILPGHWQPFWVTEDYLVEIAAQADSLERLHADLENQASIDIVNARIIPYQAEVFSHETIDCLVEIRNPSTQAEPVAIRWTLPGEWKIEPAEALGWVPGGETRAFAFQIHPAARPARRQRVAADISIGDHMYGQVTEALITVLG